MMKSRGVRLGTMSIVLMGLGAGTAHAAGFQLLEQNASGLGNAYAGSAAISENASTIFFNPAGMTYLPGVNVSAGVAAVRPSFKFSNDGTTGPGGMPGTGPNGGDAGSWGVLPNAYVSWQLAPQWHVGLGIGAPFGLMTEYEDTGWAGRYHSKKFEIRSVNVNPSIAGRVNDRLSLGAGVSWMYLDAEFSRAAPFVLPGLGYQGDLDATVDMKGDGWGWNLGMIYQLTPDTRIGLSYRSAVKIDADGDTTVRNQSVTNPVARSFLRDLSADASTSVKLPDTAVLSIVHRLNERWQLLGDVSWTGWSSITSLNIENSGNPAIGNDSLDLRFRDTWRVALGANYRLNDRWTLKGGLAWDQSPIRNSHYRPTSLPDSDRYWVSIGAQYAMSDRARIDVGYTHLFVRDTDINNATDPAAKGVVRGSYDSNANIVGVQLSHRF